MAKAGILIFDQDRVSRNIFQRFLVRDYEVKIVESKDEIKPAFQNKVYDLLLLELKIADQEGLEILRWVKSGYPGCAVVVISSYGAPEVIAQTIQQGADDCLTKPFDLETLSATVEKTLTKKKQESREKKRGLEGRKILLVDDEEETLSFYQTTFELKKARVITAGDGQEGLDKVSLELPDLVLLDVMLPQVSGFEVCRRIKNDARLKNIPVIILTARMDEKDRVKGQECGVDAFLTKPISPYSLLQQAEELLSRERGKGEENG